jgi:hypothetical protein
MLLSLPPALTKKPARIADLFALAGVVQCVEAHAQDIIQFATRAEAEAALALHGAELVAGCAPLVVKRALREPNARIAWTPPLDGEGAAPSPPPPKAARAVASPPASRPRAVPPAAADAAPTADELLFTQWGLNAALMDAMRLEARSARDRYTAHLAALPAAAPPPSEAPLSRTVLLLALPLALQWQRGGGALVAAVCGLAGEVRAVEFANVPIGGEGGTAQRMVRSAFVLFARRADAEAALALDGTPLCGTTLAVKRAQRAPNLGNAWQPAPAAAAGAAAGAVAAHADPAEPRARSRRASDDGDGDGDDDDAGDVLQSCAEWGVSHATLDALRATAAAARARHATSVAGLPAGAAPGESAKLRSVRVTPLPAALINRPHRIAALLSLAGDVDAIALYGLTHKNPHTTASAGAVVVFARRIDALAALALDGTPLCEGQTLRVGPPKRPPDLQLAWQPPHKRRRGGSME